MMPQRHRRVQLACASRRARRSLNKAIFTRLYLDGDEDNRPVVALDELNDGVAPIVRAERQPALVGARREDGMVTLFGRTYETGALTGEGAVFSEVTLEDLVDLAFGSRCSSKELMVGLTMQNAKTIITVTGTPLPASFAR